MNLIVNTENEKTKFILLEKINLRGDSRARLFQSENKNLILLQLEVDGNLNTTNALLTLDSAKKLSEFFKEAMDKL